VAKRRPVGRLFDEDWKASSTELIEEWEEWSLSGTPENRRHFLKQERNVFSFC
jgi:hypothetical protein